MIESQASIKMNIDIRTPTEMNSSIPFIIIMYYHVYSAGYLK